MLNRSRTNIGSDPELFGERAGKIIGSEQFVAEKGIRDNYYMGTVVRDGVQLELHPIQNQVPLSSVLYFGYLFRALQSNLPADVKLNFDGMVEVSKEELDGLSEASRVLGCQPSLNYYGLPAIAVNPLKYRKRSAGGHIHLGLTPDMMDDKFRLLPVLDVLLGNTCVLLDRDAGQAERRKLYGRAGEYRTPGYGIEYRTLSNFWLRSPHLADFVLSMAKECVDIVHTTVTGHDLETPLLSKIDFRKLVKGIQKNDFDLAMETWGVVREFLKQYGDIDSPLHKGNIDNFERLVARIGKDGIAKVFPDPMTEWAKVEYNTYPTVGMANYLARI